MVSISTKEQHDQDVKTRIRIRKFPPRRREFRQELQSPPVAAKVGRHSGEKNVGAHLGRVENLLDVPQRRVVLPVGF